MNEEIFRALIRYIVKQARLITDDQEALDLQILYKQWSNQIGKQLQVGEYVQYDSRLYRVLQAHIAQADWSPSSTPSLFVVIDKEHQGTIEDPIPWTVNMECFNGKYYIENDVLYKCIRDSGIALHYNCSALIGNYFELA